MTKAHTSIMHTFVHFFNKYRVHHRVTMPYHPQEKGQVKVSNKEVKNILQKSFDQMGRIGRTSFLIHYGRIERLIRHPSGCLLFFLSSRKRVTFQLSLSIENIGLSRNSTYL